MDQSALLVFERAYAHWHATGAWPHVELLQRQLAAREISAGVVAADNVGDVEELMALIFGEQPDVVESPTEREANPLKSAAGTEPAIDADRPITSVEEDLLDRAPVAQMLADQATAQLGQGFVIAAKRQATRGRSSYHRDGAPLNKSAPGPRARALPSFSLTMALSWGFSTERCGRASHRPLVRPRFAVVRNSAGRRLLCSWMRLPSPSA